MEEYQIVLRFKSERGPEEALEEWMGDREIDPDVDKIIEFKLINTKTLDI